MGKVMYKINSIFRSIQGEGVNAGRPAVFVRFAGCPLHCDFCDTDHSCKQEMKPTELYQAITDIRNPCDLVVLTGGEPTIQPLFPILQLLGERWTAIETNGTRERILCAIKSRCPNVWVTISPKYKHVSYASFDWADEVKVVWDDRMNMERINERIPGRLLDNHRCFIQPCSENYEPALKYVMDHPWWRLSVQLQKVLNVQ